MRICAFQPVEDLYRSAKAFLKDASVTNRMKLREALAKAEAVATAMGHFTKVRDRARDLYQTDDVEIDDDTLVYHNDANGYWVMGWLFVHDEEVSDATSETAERE